MGSNEKLLELLNKALFELNIALLRIEVLEAEIAFLKNPKNSSNSSMSPSKDENRPLKNQSLRGL